MISKLYAVIRHDTYKKVRAIIRSRVDKNYSLTHDEMIDLIKNLDYQTIKGKVYELFGFPEPSPVN
jgi:hypothetical protein